mgnify:CR=1 FL=1
MSFAGNQYPNFADKVITTRGDIVRGDSSGDRERYGIGAANTVLTSDGTDPSWAAHGGVPTTTKGDISGYSTTQARIPVGTNNYSLFADSAQALGLKWAASPTSTLTTTGDLLAASAANVLTRIGAGASGEVLTGNGAGALPTFQAAAGGGATDFVESFTLGSDNTSFVCTLTSAIDLTAYDVYLNWNMNSITSVGTIGLQWNGNSSQFFTTAMTYTGGSTPTSLYDGNKTTTWLSGDVDVGVGAQFCGQLFYQEASDTVRSPMFFNAWNSNNKQTIGIGWYDGGASETSLSDFTFLKSATDIEAGAEAYVWRIAKT